MAFYIKRFILIFAAVLISGCAYTTAYNPSYLAAARRPSSHMVDGKVLIVTTVQDDVSIYTGNPTSFTGSGTTLTLPIGSIVKEAAVAAFSDTFKGGAHTFNWGSGTFEAIPNAEQYTAIVAPRLVSYSYEYNQLKNAGFAITPTAVVAVEVRVVDSKGATRFQKQYMSGPVEAESYMVNFSPHEEISKVTHKAFYDMFSNAAADVAREFGAKPKVPTDSS